MTAAVVLPMLTPSLSLPHPLGTVTPPGCSQQQHFHAASGFPRDPALCPSRGPRRSAGAHVRRSGRLTAQRCPERPRSP